MRKTNFLLLFYMGSEDIHENMTMRPDVTIQNMQGLDDRNFFPL